MNTYWWKFLNPFTVKHCLVQWHPGRTKSTPTFNPLSAGVVYLHLTHMEVNWWNLNYRWWVSVSSKQMVQVCSIYGEQKWKQNGQISNTGDVPHQRRWVIHFNSQQQQKRGVGWGGGLQHKIMNRFNDEVCSTVAACLDVSCHLWQSWFVWLRTQK